MSDTQLCTEGNDTVIHYNDLFREFVFGVGSFAPLPKINASECGDGPRFENDINSYRVCGDGSIPVDIFSVDQPPSDSFSITTTLNAFYSADLPPNINSAFCNDAVGQCLGVPGPNATVSLSELNGLAAPSGGGGFTPAEKGGIWAAVAFTAAVAVGVIVEETLRRARRLRGDAPPVAIPPNLTVQAPGGGTAPQPQPQPQPAQAPALMQQPIPVVPQGQAGGSDIELELFPSGHATYPRYPSQLTISSDSRDASPGPSAPQPEQRGRLRSRPETVHTSSQESTVRANEHAPHTVALEAEPRDFLSRTSGRSSSVPTVPAHLLLGGLRSGSATDARNVQPRSASQGRG